MVKPKIIFFALLMLLSIPLTAVHAQDVTPLSYGDSLTGRITDSDEGNLYSFEGQEGDTVIISAFSNDIDVYIRLGNSQGEILEEHDDISSDNLNAEIEYELPDDGMYIIAVLGYSEGRYTLSLESEGGSQPPSQGGTNVSDEGGLSYGDAVNGEAIDMETPVVFTFVGSAGDTVAISVSSDDVDTYIVLADSDGNSLAENDDISQDNLNSYVEAVLPANGEYLIGVFAYDSGPFTLELTLGGGSGPTQPVTDSGQGGEVLTGTITGDEYFARFPLDNVQQGQTVTIDARRTSGDLDLYIGLLLGDEVVAENDDRDPSNTDSYLEYPQAEAGDYTVIVTRYGYEEGETEGDFEVEIKVSAGGTTLVSDPGTTTSNPVASGYPNTAPTASVADWTVLAYIGADNNLEDFLENDLNEFELGGGSNQSVRIIVLLDRSDEFSRSNDDWTDTRLFEVTADESGDERQNFPPTIDSVEIVSLGELDTSYGQNLQDFLVWGVQAYPAQHYAVVVNDHGGAWYGTVTDDTTGRGILGLPDLAEAFDGALQTTGVNKFDLLINDACLMSGVEHYAAVAPYFDYALGSPEVTLAVSFDMTLLTQVLNQDPGIDIGELGTLMSDKYLADMEAIAPDTVPVLGANVTDLRQFDDVVTSLNGFASVISDNPRAYGSLLADVRANTYTYSFFIPEEQGGPATNIDVGHFMQGIIENSNDQDLTGAAQDVIDALDTSLIYGTAGQQLARATSFYNIYFPARATDFDPNYFEKTPLQDWAQMLRDYFTSVNPQSRSFSPVTSNVVSSPLAAPSAIPQVNITHIFPEETSVAFPIKVSMEVTGRNIAFGNFTVDQVQPDGTAIRLETSRIVTEIVEDNVVDYINFWNPGVDDSDFTWDVEVPQVTDGTISGFEQVSTQDSVSSLAGRYRSPGEENWNEVTVLFADDGTTESVVSSSDGAFAGVRLEAGGEFQTYILRVTADGRVTTEPGTIFTWPEDGLTWEYVPAPSGQYNLGFLVEAAGGTTGFNSATITVNNDGVDTSLRGYADDDWGFIFQRPADWFGVNYFPESEFLQTSDTDSTEFMFVYPVYETEDDLKGIANDVLSRYDVEFDGKFTPITVADKEAVEFEFTYGNDETGIYTSRAFAVYIDYLELGLVFSSEALDPANTESNYALLRDTMQFFNATEVEAEDAGFWTADIYTENTRYPVPENWMPGYENGLWWYYTPENAEDSAVFAAATVLNTMDEDAPEVLDLVLEEEIESFDNYELISKETYYGEQHTWETALFTHEGPNGEEVTGAVYVTVMDEIPYVLWFEAPSDEFADTFRNIFTVMLDGYKIDEVEEE
ncbi:MAG: pre-peptidase C-terminal domain-containing protein [Anaerolineae bacterium]|nr:pre-peptidase C-terminal domain-containing protein [Anaerolineae bacterium]